MKYVIEMTSSGLTYIPSFVEMGTDIQAILFCLNSLKGYNVGIRWRWRQVA
jgi:hypothetical protein